MISGILDTIFGSIDSVGDALCWVFVIAVFIIFLKGNNNKGGNRSSNSGGSPGSSTNTPAS